MTTSGAIGILFSIISLSYLVVGDPLSVVVFNELTVTNYPNDYFGDVSSDVNIGKKNPPITLKLPIIKELPETMQMTLAFKGPADEEPVTFTINLCEGISDPLIGASLVRAGQPKNKFPKSCPFVAGDWQILKWKPPVENIPPYVPDGKFSASITVAEEGKPPYIRVACEGELSHDVPGLGR